MRKTGRQFRLQASEDLFDHQKQTRYCIEFSKKHFETKKQQSFLNKLTFDYSLQKINRQKFIGNLLPVSARMYPAIKAQGNKLCNFQYSAQSYKTSRNRFLSQRLSRMAKPDQEQNQKQQLTKVKHIIRKRQGVQGGGLDSFWIFKKNPNKEERKKVKAMGADGEGNDQQEQTIQNKIEQAYYRILNYGKLPLQLENSLIPKNVFKNYISSIFGQTFCLWFISFYQFKNYINFKQFETICEKFSNVKLRQCHLISFFLYDENGDGFLCPRDFFAVFQRQMSAIVDQDILKLGLFLKKNIGRQNPNNQQYLIQTICIRDDWLTIKDYEMYFKKVDEPYLKATNKKDTVFSKSFAVLDHRQKIRSKRKQMNQKKNYYYQLYGEMASTKNNVAYIDSEADYKLDYTFFRQVFGSCSPELYKYFVSFVFGVEGKRFQ